MMVTINQSEKTDELDFFIQQYISQIYLINPAGIVKFARIFDNKEQIEPQLLGSFLTALETFVDITATQMHHHDVRLLDVGTSESRWFLKRSGGYLFVILVPVNSFFLKANDFGIVYDIMSDILTSFLYHYQTKIGAEIDFQIDDEFETDVNDLILEKINAFAQSYEGFS